MIARIAAWLIVAGTVVAGRQTAAPAAPSVQSARTSQPRYVVYYWRAKPGMLDAYNEYIKGVAEPIDESARKAGVFEEVHTYLASSTDWTHVRVFKLADGGTPEALSGGLDGATKRMQPDEAKRAENSARAAGLRDFVKQEVWTELR
jgi:hypothetical protein